MKYLRSHIMMAGLLTVGAIIWMASGVFGKESSDREHTASIDDSTKLFKVEARTLAAQSYSQPIRFWGRTKENKQVLLKAQITGLVVNISDKEGAFVKKGEMICEIDVRDRKFLLNEASARFDKAKLDYQAALKLKLDGYQSHSAIANAKTELESAKTRLQRARIDLDSLIITAPFDGFLQKMHAEIGDYLQLGNNCATLIDLDPIVTTAKLTAESVSKVVVGSKAMIELIDGRSMTGQLHYLSKRSDVRTLTYEVELHSENQGSQIPSGMTAKIEIKGKKIDAHKIPSSLLSLDDEGNVGVKVLSPTNIVQFAKVNLLSDDTTGIWVTGLADPVKLVTIGQEYVALGQKVDVQWKTEQE